MALCLFYFLIFILLSLPTPILLILLCTMATSTVYLANLSKNINNEALNIPADASLVNYFVEPLPELVLSQNQASSGTPEPQAGAQILVQRNI